ncbi:hypothetical protein J7E96_18270 [Streptomyces sp. ISL-96]|uniref:hypothetical protein n=1 Tax=Streptomyces sp. ISL-96 TaxID=2819191 RepID=UPI001BEC2053|nr:hypothetical protein [Streptomyces sp. ISL-96]MBT2490429.1 hypothetical protein [Streptomyces sp. ISL-96]
MRRHGLTHGRRGAATSAATVVLCLGGVLAACGGGSGDDDGYVAVGTAGSGPERGPGRAVPPEGKVELVPLDGDSARGGGDGDGGDGRGSPSPSSPSASSSSSSSAPESGADEHDRGTPGAGGEEPSGDGGSPGSTDAPGVPGDGSDSGGGGGGDNGTNGGSDGGTSTKPPVTGTPGTPGAPSSPAPPAGPAVLKLGDPVLAAGEKRWCEKVTVPFSNTGESAVRSGTVTFATHIIGALGVDWDTRMSTQPLPGPIAAGAAVKKTYTVCVDAWRVPLGMRIETQKVTADWQ